MRMVLLLQVSQVISFQTLIIHGTPTHHSWHAVPQALSKPTPACRRLPLTVWRSVHSWASALQGYTNAWPQNKIFCAVSSGKVNSYEQREMLFATANSFPWRGERKTRITTPRMAESQKQSPRIEWKYTWRKSTVSTLIKQRERLQFLYVAIQTNHHCTSENFSLKTNMELSACLWQSNTDNKSSYSLIF